MTAMTAMRVLTDMASPARRAPTLLVLLPGALQMPETLLEEGMAAAVRARGLAVDIALVDPGLRTINEATDGSVAARLASLLAPARQDYSMLWLAGVSLGGFMALAHAARHPDHVDGLFLLAPYPGNRLLTGAIDAAGGPVAWAAEGPANAADDEENAWRWLAHNGRAGRPEIHLGHADADRFAGGQRLMAQLLPPERVALIAGGHDWPSWRTLWNNFLDRHGERLNGPAR
jgi:pimeloyl-ACP methyl ester carboxylesterase